MQRHGKNHERKAGMSFNELDSSKSLELQGLKLPPICQTGIIVPDLKKAADYYSRVLSVKKWYATRITHQEAIYRGEPVDQHVDIVVGYMGGMQIELICQQCDSENIYNAVLGKGGRGFHHLGVTVSDLDKKVEMVQKAGIEPLQWGTIRFGKGGVTRYAYLDTLETAGFVLEFIETRAFGIHLGMPEWIINFGRITGDTELYR